jgi:hypothetical protein
MKINEEMKKSENKITKLSEIRKENPFRVPPDYFDDFYSRLQQRLNEETVVKKSNSAYRILKPAFSIAATVALIFMLIYWPLNRSRNLQTAENNSEFFEYNVESVLIGLMERMDDNSLLTFFEGEPEEDTFSDEELISYLSSNLSDYDLYLMESTE